MSAPSRRRQADTTPVTACRCPAGYPLWTFPPDRPDGAGPVREHHPNMCGLPDQVEQEGSR